ncbi:hypothetical protein PCANC_25226 [Puccinia coronata f. sp. avenae]|uniref:DH domain-containing protein n=1 Tax=Puccinia coronata f. sp. avenae TaxID=200324 RepID=A0A2N5TKN6_9BASI|nr:hypothetical protein PCANC_25226 [Puccinia coronata f. sp. avenae]
MDSPRIIIAQQQPLRQQHSLSKPRPISYHPSGAATSQQQTTTPRPHSTLMHQQTTPPSLQTLSQLRPLPTLNTLNSPPTSTTKSTLVDVVVEGMGGGNDPGEGWQVPPELVFFLRSLGERLDPFSPTGNQSSSASGPTGHTKSLTAALNHATLRPTTEQAAIMALFTELVVTERAYLKRIAALNQSYAIPLKNFSKSSQTKIIDKYEATSMFGKIEAVVSANTSLLNVLETCLQMLEQEPSAGHWAHLLSNELLNIQRPYRDYLAGYDIIKETEQKLLKKSEGFRQFCERTKEAMYDDGMGRVGLRELLMEPVQRVTRYILIFEQMLKKMSSNDEARSGLLSCIAICNRLAVCELDPETIKAATMYGLARSIDHFPPILVKQYRYFIDAIDVLDIIPDTPNPTVLHCTLFLFNDTIVIAKKPSNGQLTGKVLAGLDDMDRLVAAMIKSKGTSSSLNSVVSGSTDFFSKSLGVHNTPTKLKKGSMRFKGLIDVHDVIVANEAGPTGVVGSTSEVSFDLYLDRPPQDVSERWTDRRYRHYVVCAPPTPTAALSGHEKSLSLSSHPTSSHHQSSIPLHPTSHSLSHKSHLHLRSQHAVNAALAERDRFLDNLRKCQALVKAADDRSTVMRTKFVNENDNQAVIDSFWNLYDKQTYLAEQRKHRVVLQLVGTDVVDPLQFVTESVDPAPPLMIIRAHFNDPDDPDCRVHVRRKPNHVFTSLNASIDKAEEDIVVQTECLSGLIVRIIQAYGIADIPNRGNTIFSTSMQQQYSGTTNPPSPSRGFRAKSGSILMENNVNSALPHRLFGAHHGKDGGLSRTKSIKSSAHSKGVSSSSVTLSQPGTPTPALREIQPTATRSPGGPVWYRNAPKGVGVSRGDNGPSRFAPKEALGGDPGDSNVTLYDDLPRLREEPEDERTDRSSSPARSTLKGKARGGSAFEAEEEEQEEQERDGEPESESMCSSVSGLSSYEDETEEKRSMNGGTRTRGGLVGPRQPVVALERGNSISSSRSNSMNRKMTRAMSEPPGKEGKSGGLGGGFRIPETVLQTGADRFAAASGSRNVSGSSLGKRSRSVDAHADPSDADTERDERVKRVQTLPLVVRKPPPPAPDPAISSASAPAPAPAPEHSKTVDGRNSPARPAQHRGPPPFNSDAATHSSLHPDHHGDDDQGDTQVSAVDHTDEAVLMRVEEIGTTDLYHDIKGRIKLMKSQLKKLKHELGKLDLAPPAVASGAGVGAGEGASSSTGGGGGTGLRGSRAMNGSIPRSPRKLHLSEVAKATEHASLLKASPHSVPVPAASSSSSSTAVAAAAALAALVADIDKSADGIDRKVRQVQTVETDAFQAQHARYTRALSRVEKEVQKTRNSVLMERAQHEVTRSMQAGLELENSHLYDAFNEELDKMFNDIQLPPAQSLNLLIQDLKRIAEERGKLSTLLGSTQRQLELECAKSGCLENLLRDAGLLS